MNRVVMVMKAGALVLYAVALAAWLVPVLAPYREILLYITLFLAVAHLGEYVWIKKRLAELDPQGRGHLVNTLLFGFLHWLPILRAGK